MLHGEVWKTDWNYKPPTTYRIHKAQEILHIDLSGASAENTLTVCYQQDRVWKYMRTVNS